MTPPILVLGAGRGLGRALCHFFLERGTPVIGVTRTQESVVALRDTFASHLTLFQGEALDLSDRDASLTFLHDLKTDRFPTMAIYTTGHLAGRKPLWDLSWEEIDREVAANLFGPLFWAVELSRTFVSMGQGGHLFFSSGVVRSPRPAWGGYGVLKSAVEALTRQMALDLPPPLYSLSINPGRMATSMRRTAFPEEDPTTLPLPESVAGRIGAFAESLVGGAGRFHNGKNLTMEDIP